MTLLSVLLLLVLSVLAQAQVPRVVDGQVEVLGSATDLGAELASLREGVRNVAWTGYAVAGIEGLFSSCCDGVCSLEEGSRGWSDTAGDSSEIVVLYRLSSGVIDRIRVFPATCILDAGGRTVYWWESVSSEASLESLRSVVAGEGPVASRESALHAIARHAGEAPNGILDEFIDSQWPMEIREKSVFWLGAIRGEGGFRKLSVRYRTEPTRKLRERMIFALHLSGAEGAVARLVEIAGSDEDGRLREKAIFWLAQRAGERAVEAIASAVENDPELEVKKKAVFALSQLPPDDGVPLLIEVAESHLHPELRKKAFFWLGQSGDPRALAFFKDVLLER